MIKVYECVSYTSPSVAHLYKAYENQGTCYGYLADHGTTGMESGTLASRVVYGVRTVEFGGRLARLTSLSAPVAMTQNTKSQTFSHVTFDHLAERAIVFLFLC